MAMVGVDCGSLAWSESRRPLCAVLHSSNEPGELSQWLCHNDSTINIGMCIIFIFIIFLNPRKTRVGKKLKKLKRMERLMFRAVVQLKTIVQQNRIETK